MNEAWIYPAPLVMFYVYMLKSKLYDQAYVGSTKDLKRRFLDHNDGKETSTKRYKPWSLLYYEAYINEKLARIREKRLKHNGNALRELKKRIGIIKSSTFLHEAFNPRSKPQNFKKVLDKSGAGFTLIELLIVIIVIGILAAGIISIVNPVAQFQKAWDVRRKSDLAQIEKALETFYKDNGKYPDSRDYKIKSLSENVSVDWGTPWLPYMGTLPKDPSSAKNYVYSSASDGQTYCIYASLDREIVITSFGSCFPSGASCGTGYSCNYGVSSSNISP